MPSCPDAKPAGLRPERGNRNYISYPLKVSQMLVLGNDRIGEKNEPDGLNFIFTTNKALAGHDVSQ